MWCWGNEILVGFSRGWYKDLGPKRHHFDREKPEEHWLARSLDGGETWTLEHPAEKGQLIPRGESLHGVETPGVAIHELQDCPGGVPFTHPDFAMTLRLTFYAPNRGVAYDAGCDIREAVKKRFDAEGIEIPYPYQNVIIAKHLAGPSTHPGAEDDQHPEEG